MKKRIGFTTSIPIEVLFAANVIPVDLNNLFVNAENPFQLVRMAEEHGFPRNYCAWIKGLFSTVLDQGIDTLVMVHEGECTNSQKLTEQFQARGITCHIFSYPAVHDSEHLRLELSRLMVVLGVSEREVLRVKEHLDRIRMKLQKLDRSSYQDLNVSSIENFTWLISSSDFGGDYTEYEMRLDRALCDIEKRPKGMYEKNVRLGLVGIPPIMNNVFSVVESFQGSVIYNEMPRQFSMVHFDKGLYEQYARFTYPYSMHDRLKDITTEIRTRRVQGIIHYVQSFCPRQIDDIELRRSCDVPVLTIEGDRPGALDERNITRIEAFLERWK